MLHSFRYLFYLHILLFLSFVLLHGDGFLSVYFAIRDKVSSRYGKLKSSQTIDLGSLNYSVINITGPDRIQVRVTFHV